MSQPTDTFSASEVYLRRFAGLSFFAAIWTYALIVFGGIVRITGSGLGCGNNWPKCNGSWIPPFTIETLIEYTHRLLGVSIGLVLIGVFAYALLHRRDPGFRGKGGVLRPATLVLVLVVVQGLLGAVTVWFEIPPAVVVVHFSVALTIMAILLVAGMRANALTGRVAGTKEGTGTGTGTATGMGMEKQNARAALIAAALGFASVVMGAMVANNVGAPQACQGFPLCNGSLLPAGQSLVHIHWTHRLFAFATFFYVLYQAYRTWQRTPASGPRTAAAFAAAVVVLQVIVAAGLVLMHLPRELQALHLAVGAALWAILVVWASVTRAVAKSDIRM